MTGGRAFTVATSFLLVTAPSAMAAAGSGSSGYGGGGSSGGYGGGYSGGGGAGSAGDGNVSIAGAIALVALIMLIVWAGKIVTLYQRADRASDDVRFRWRQRKRGRAVELAAAEAAAEDQAFAVARVKKDAEKLFRLIQAAWSRNDTERLDELVAPELMKEWRLRLADFERKGWHNQIDVKSVEVEYVGVVNREPDEEDRVVLRIAARMDDYVVGKRGDKLKRKDSQSETVELREWWTLGKRDGRWALLSIEQREEGEHHMESELVAAPEHDSRIGDDAITELAGADKVAEGFTVAEVADLDFDGSAHDAALDLALADGRFAPDVLEAAARRALAAWVEAVDGEDAALERIASREAIRELLHPEGERTRLVVRGGSVLAVRITGLDAAAEPPRMTIEIDVSGCRYVEDRDTAAVVSGSKDKQVQFTERWTLALAGSDDAPWQVVDVTELAAAEP
jgi:predicted lipid-binding transport protein (Tim44 family)